MSTTSSLPVAIVGAGPCGLFAALLLARRGIRCTVFERKPGLSTHPKAMGISRRSAEIFQQAGVFDALYEPCRHLTEAPGVSLHVFVRSFVGEEWGRIPLTEPLSPLSPGPAFHCPQTLTEEVLFAALEQVAPGSVRFNTEVTAVTPADSEVTFVAAGETWQADWLIAADGAGGQIRHELKVESDGPGDMGHFLNVFFRAPYGPHLEGRRSMLFSVLKEGDFGIFVAVNGDDLWLMHHFLLPGQTPADFPREKLAEVIRQLSGLPEIPVEVLSISPWVMSPKVSRKFRVGRVLLTGDAAARMSPSGGLGLNTGLQSVHNLAWKLAAVIQGRASETLLDTYAEERRGAALWTLDNTNKNAGEIFAIYMAAAENQLDKVRPLIAQNGRAGSRLGIDLGIEYPEGALVPDGTDAVPRRDAVNDYFPNARPGSRAPFVKLGDGRSTFDLLGPEFTVLAAQTAPEVPENCAVHAITDSAFKETYQLDPGGCVFIRPDGYVAARWKTAPHSGEIAETLQRVLHPAAD